MSDQADTARRFLELHATERPLLLPNPWDIGSARMLAWVGFDRVAAYGALLDAARELRESGTYEFLQRARVGFFEGAKEAFSTPPPA